MMCPVIVPRLLSLFPTEQHQSVIISIVYYMELLNDLTCLKNAFNGPSKVIAKMVDRKPSMQFRTLPGSTYLTNGLVL